MTAEKGEVIYCQMSLSARHKSSSLILLAKIKIEVNGAGKKSVILHVPNRPS